MKGAKKHINRIALLLVLASAVFACVEPFDLKTEDFESVLVVDAMITDELKLHEIKITRTYRLEEDGPSPEKGATVEILDDTGTLFIFAENELGVYVASEIFATTPGKSYQLKITTVNGREYSSGLEVAPQPTQIDDINVERGTNGQGIDGMTILVDSFDPSRNSNYYRYTYEETYKIIPPFSRADSLYSVNSSYPNCEVAFALINPFAERGSRCFGQDDSSRRIVLTSTVGLSEDRVNRFAVRFIPKTAPIIAHRYSILVNQLVISNSAFSFYETLRDFSGSESLFSQTQPGFIEGNMMSEDNPDERVIGFFTVAAIASERLFMDYEDVFTEGDNPQYFFSCGAFAPPISTTLPRPGCPLSMILQEGTLIYGGPNDNPGFDEGPHNMVQRRCGDCREFASEEAPDFWID